MTNEAEIEDTTKKNVLICDTQPVAVEGMKWLIENSGDLQFAGSVYTLDAAFEWLCPEAAKAARELAAEEAARLEAEALEMQAAEAKIIEEQRLEAQAMEAQIPGMESLSTEPLAAETPEAETVQTVESPVPVLQATESLPSEVTDLPADSLTVETTAVEAAALEAAALETAPLEATVEDAPEALPLPPPLPIHAIVIDKGLGLLEVMELLHKLTATSHPTPAIVWGSAISEPEALRLLQAGARGILRRTSESGTLLTCLRAVTSGGTWMEDGIFGSTEKLYNRRRSELTHRESEVVVLVEKGLRNRDIARMLGIQTGTVKIHLKHIFEKTGVRGRYGLALTGLQNKGAITLTAPPQFTA